MTGQIRSSIAILACPNCEVSDVADPFFVRDPADGHLVCVVTRCRVCGFLQLL
jgi:hypothetical protein